jgi:hypothetical protein
MQNTMNKFDWDGFMQNILRTEGKHNLIKYILNEKNRLITEDYITEVLKNYNIEYEVQDLKLFQIAMTHPSYIYKDWEDIKNFKMIL